MWNRPIQTLKKEDSKKHWPIFESPSCPFVDQFIDLPVVNVTNHLPHFFAFYLLLSWKGRRERSGEHEIKEEFSCSLRLVATCILFTASRFGSMNLEFATGVSWHTSSQFHQHFTYKFFVQFFCQSQNVTRKTKFVRKIRAFNVDEIDGKVLPIVTIPWS